MAPQVKKKFNAYIDSIKDAAIEWQDYSRSQSITNVFKDDLRTCEFRVDLQKVSKDPQGASEEDHYLQLSVQANREAVKSGSSMIAKNMKGSGKKSPVYATLKIHEDARPSAATFKETMLEAGANCHENRNGEPVSTCIKIEPDGSWRDLHTGETGKGTVFNPPGQNAPDPAPAQQAAQEEPQGPVNGGKKGKKGGKKGGN